MKLEDEILISAYLDGEVSSDEKLRAEQLLAASAEARQLAEELRVVRSRLQDLPRFGLPADFAQQTLRRAEQELAAARAVDAAIGASGGAAAMPLRQSGSSVSSPQSAWATWRGFAWAGIALAAALMIWITNRPPANQGVEVAKHERVTTSDKPPQIAAAKNNASEEHSALVRPNTPPQAIPAPAGLNSPSPAPSQIANDLPARSEPTLTIDGISKEMPKLGATGGANPNIADPQSRMFSGETNGMEISGGGRGSQNRNLAGTAVNRTAGADSSKPLIVYVDITAEAASHGEFDRLLSKHQIKVDETVMKRQQTATRREPSDKLEQSQGQLKKPTDSEADRGASGKLNDELSRGAPNAPADSEFEFVYVEASPEQLDETLRDLKATQDSFLTVSVASFLPLPQLENAQKNTDGEKSAPPASSSPTPENAASNPAAAELLAPKPSEKDQAAGENQPSAQSSSQEKSNVAPSNGQAKRLAGPNTKAKSDATPTDPKAKLRSDSINKSEPTSEPPSPTGALSDAASDGRRQSTAKSSDPQLIRKQALFVLRRVEAKTPAAAAQPANSEPASQR